MLPLELLLLILLLLLLLDDDPSNDDDEDAVDAVSDEKLPLRFFRRDRLSVGLSLSLLIISTEAIGDVCPGFCCGRKMKCQQQKDCE